MGAEQSNISMLHMFTHPVFLVKDGVILGANQAARDLQIKENTPITDLLCFGDEAYRTYTGGALSLSIRIEAATMIASVIRINGSDFFHLNCENQNSDLQALALASQQLRDPLTNVIALADSLMQYREEITEKEKVRFSQLEQNLHRLLRSVGNMSDAQSCGRHSGAMEHWNLTAVIADAVHYAMEHADNEKRSFVFSEEGDSVNGLADRELLERAVYNMLSNAIRHSDPGTPIQININSDKKRIRFTVENFCQSCTQESLGTMFFRYQRAPGLNSHGSGLGLGIPIIRSIASSHKGSLLATLPEPGKIRFALTIPVLHDNSGKLRSPVLRPDYSGGFDQGLIELSDVLPSDAYKK